MKIEYCNKSADRMMGFVVGGVGSWIIMQGIVSTNIYLMGFGGISIAAGAVNLKNSFDKANIVEASIEELAGLSEIKTMYVCAESGQEKEFTGKIERFSNYDVKNISGKITNIRTTGVILQDHLVDLVDEEGYSIPCILPLNTKLKDGQKMNLSAYLRKITMPDKTSKNGLVVYSLN